MKKVLLLWLLVVFICVFACSCESNTKEELSRVQVELEQKNEEIKRLEEELSALKDKLHLENEYKSELKEKLEEETQNARRLKSQYSSEKRNAEQLEESLQKEKETSERLKGILTGEIKNTEEYELPVIYLSMPEPGPIEYIQHYKGVFTFDSLDTYVKAIIHKDTRILNIKHLDRMFKKTEYGYMLTDPTSIIYPKALEERYKVYNLDIIRTGGYAIRYIMDESRTDAYIDEGDEKSGTMLFTRETEESYKFFLDNIDPDKISEFTDNGVKYTVCEEYVKIPFQQRIIDLDNLNAKNPIIVRVGVASDRGYYSLKYFYPDKFITKEELIDIFSFLNE